mmetsp:Transcript_142718/g.248879  ORF Transcript_142718/g.248879 Transcript_142718/m.248879 type:complete len:581 (-) Transcript_142718:95-1837(-)
MVKCKRTISFQTVNDQEMKAWGEYAQVQERLPAGRAADRIGCSRSSVTRRRGLMCFCLAEDEEEDQPRSAAPPSVRGPVVRTLPRKAPSKGKGKGKGRVPAPPPKRPERSTSSPRMDAAPAWKGPQPTEGLKSARVVNWNPIRHTGLLEGSVWQQVNENLEQRGHHLVSKEILNSAFMRSADELSKKDNATASRRARDREHRILPAREALVGDLLHCQLARQGLTDLDRLCYIVGVVLDKPDSPEAETRDSDDSSSSQSSGQRSPFSDTDSDSDTSSEDEPEPEKQDRSPLAEESLQTLLTFLRLAEGVEDKLKSLSDASLSTPLAAPERLLRELLLKVGPVSLLRSRVQAMLRVQCFPREADNLERIMRSGIQAARAVVESKALPVLLEGVLLLGNYVNSSSNSLGSALGVTLESLVKLEHTRALAAQSPSEGATKESEKAANALCLLVRQLQASQDPEFLDTLICDLQGCRVARELECSAASLSVKDLEAQVHALEVCLESFPSCPAGEEPPASFPARLKRFNIYAKPRLAMLRSLEEDLQSATVAMRKYFAEPATTPLNKMLRSLATLLDVLMIAAR